MKKHYAVMLLLSSIGLAVTITYRELNVRPQTFTYELITALNIVLLFMVAVNFLKLIRVIDDEYDDRRNSQPDYDDRASEE